MVLKNVIKANLKANVKFLDVILHESLQKLDIFGTNFNLDRKC